MAALGRGAFLIGPLPRYQASCYPRASWIRHWFPLLIMRFVSPGINDKLQEQGGNYAIHIAAIKGNQECLQMLLHAG